MPYTLYLDKHEDFIAEVSVKNASLKNSLARIIVEADNGLNLMFNGKIENGKCIVPIKKLKGLLEENTKGTMKMEIVVEDTYFKPWEQDFVVEEHTAVKVKVNEQKENKSSKPIVEVKSHPLSKYLDGNDSEMTLKPAPKKGVNLYTPLYELSKLCEKFEITKKNLKSKKPYLVSLLKEYFNANPEFNAEKTVIIKSLPEFIK